jgi:hypothetical protein
MAAFSTDQQHRAKVVVEFKEEERKEIRLKIGKRFQQRHLLML